jgi:hypothetical protein
MHPDSASTGVTNNFALADNDLIPDCPTIPDNQSTMTANVHHALFLLFLLRPQK